MLPPPHLSDSITKAYFTSLALAGCGGGGWVEGCVSFTSWGLALDINLVDFLGEKERSSSPWLTLVAGTFNNQII